MYMYKHALFDLLNRNKIKLNVFEKPDFYNNLVNGTEVVRYLISNVNNVNSSNSTQQEQSQSQQQEQNQSQQQEQSQSRVM